MSWHKRLLTAALVSLLACTRGQEHQVEVQMKTSSTWTVKSSEAFDALMLVNAISQDSHYNQRYPGLRSIWAGRLGSAGIANADAIFETVSMSGAVRLLYALKPEGLGDLVSGFSRYDETRARIEQSLSARGGATEYERQDLQALDRNRQQFLEYLRALQRAGYSSDWDQTCKPAIEKQAADLRTSLAELPDGDTARTLARFLRCPRTPTRGIILLYYASPIGFQLPDGVMAVEAGEPIGVNGFLAKIPGLGRVASHGWRLQKARQFAAIALHESLHGFPHSAEAIALQDALIAKSPTLTREYTALKTQWHEGPEEYAVVAGEAYLSETLGIRSHKEAETYLKNENGGMTFSMMIFTALDSRKPDTHAQWTGYGDWLVTAMREGVIR
jgi:hypothetical protein